MLKQYEYHYVFYIRNAFRNVYDNIQILNHQFLKQYFLFLYSEETADVVDECRRLAGTGGKGARRNSGRGTDKISTISMLSSTRSIAALNRWRIAGGKGKCKPRQMPGTAPRLSCDSQQQDTHNEITYVPTSALKSAMAEEQKNGSGGGTLEEENCRNEYDEEDKVIH